MDFDEDLAIQYIRQHVDASRLSNMDDDTILDIIDIIWDYYEDHGQLDINLDDDDDDDVDIDDLTRHVVKMFRKSNPSMGRSRESAEALAATLRLIVLAEIDYENTL